MKKLFTLMLLLLMTVMGAWAEDWSIDFSEIGTNNKLADKAGATISSEVSGGLGTVVLGEELNSNFGLQVGTSWMYRTQPKALYSSNNGNRNFGVLNAIKDQYITLNTSAAPTPTNATLQSTDGNVRVYKVTANGTVIFNLTRYNYIYSISVTTPPSTNREYTVKYVDGSGNELKSSSTKSGKSGSSIIVDDSDKASISANDTKYIYDSDDASGKTIADDGSTVVTITFREAASYTLNAKYDGTVISTTSVFEGDNGSVYVPYYQFVAGTLYGKPSVDKGSLSYGQITINNITADTDVNVTYTAEANQDVVFYSEAEKISSLTAYSDLYTQVRMSNGAVAYAAVDGTVIATLPAGIYTLTTSTRAGTTRFFAGNVNVLEIVSTGSVYTTTSEEFTLTSSTDITVNAGGKSAYFDYVLIRKTGEASLSPAINASGFGTFSAAFPVQIEGAKVYAAQLSEDGTKLVCTEVEGGKVPAGVGVILVKDGEGDVTATAIAEATAIADNDLAATTLADGSLATKSGDALVLSGDMFKLYSGDTFAANKAYLPYSAAAKLTLVFDDATGAVVVEADAIEAAPAKYINANGQLVIGNYNALGQQIK